MKKHFFLFFLLLPVFLIFSLFRASGVSAAVATCISPANGSTVNPSNVAFAWSAVSGAPGYHFRLERNDPWAEVIIRNDIPGTSFTGSEGRNAGADLGSPINLTAGKSYHWRVWPSNALEEAAGSSCDFTVATPPTQPTVSFTANPSSVTSGQSTTLTWSSTNAVKCILNPPGVYKTVDPSGTDSFSPTTATTYNIRCEGPSGPVDSATASTTVTVTAAPIAIPGSPTNPSASCSAPGTTANFSWTGVSGATRYDLYVHNTADPALVWGSGGNACTSPNSCERLTTTSKSLSARTPGATYQWFVFACNSSGCSSEAGGSFTCAAPVTVAAATFNGQPLDLTGATTLSARLALPGGTTSVDVPVDVTDSSGSTRHLIIRFNYLLPPKATLSITSGSQNTTVGGANSFKADLTNAGSGQIWVTKGDGASSFTCPNGIYRASTGKHWCPIVKASGSTLTGSYTFAEAGTYTTVVNAFTKSDQTGTGPSDECTGTPSSIGYDANVWSDCGEASRTTITVGASTLPPPTNPAASCPAPGTTANFSWTGVSGATRYDLYVHNTADPALTWGSGGNACTSPNSCERLTTTSKSLSARTPGATYQWFVFACNSSGCSSEAGGSFTCGGSSTSIPGDADDNSCVNNADLAQWTKEVKGDCHRCSAWTPGTTPPTRKLAEDYNIWYDAFKNAKTLCGPAPASNCTTNVCQ